MLNIAHYVAPIKDFIKEDKDQILGQLTRAHGLYFY